MLTFEQLAPQMAALIAVLAVPCVLGYLGVKHTLRFLIAARRGLSRDLWSANRRLLVSVWGANLFLITLFAYGWLWEAHWVERVDVTLEVGLPHPVRIVHLSDLHLEGFGAREERALEIVQEASPDLILLTGDYTSKGSGKRYLPELRRFLRALEPSAGVFAVPGNWDADGRALFEGTSIEYLPGRTSKVEVGEASVALSGSWFDAAPPPADSTADLTVYLQHSPDFLKEASAAGYDFYLAGHTHGGQVRIPGFGALVTLSRHWKQYESGLFREGNTYLYVNRGLGLEGGLAPRIRLFCRPEVTVIEVR